MVVHLQYMIPLICSLQENLKGIFSMGNELSIIWTMKQVYIS